MDEEPRGFAVKFYAGSPQGDPKQGCIWDLVGNNFPVGNALRPLQEGMRLHPTLGTRSPAFQDFQQSTMQPAFSLC